MYSTIFWALVATCAATRFGAHLDERSSSSSKDGANKSPRSPEFSRFQLNYLIVYLLAVGADWMQGPYVYALYTEYGYGKKEIGELFIAGFGSSMVFGTFVGSFADKFGRKANAIVYALSYALSCATKHSPNFGILLVGRLLAGIATSILYSAFESWLVSEHNRRAFDPSLLSETFSKAQFGNAVVAIVAGQIAGFVADAFGKVAPFDTSALALGVLSVIVMTSWTENYGDQSRTLSGGLKAAWLTLISNERILLVGTIQSCFEGAMYLMVFSWTPALQAASDAGGGGEIPHGMIFSTFMVCIMLGSTLFSILLKGQPVEAFSRNCFVVGAICFAVTAISPAVRHVYGALLAFEVICGVYFPAMGTMRAKYIPEETRAAIMNFLRVPLNMIVCATLYLNFSNETVWKLCCALLSVCVVCQHRLYIKSKAAPVAGGEESEKSAMLAEGSAPVEAA